MAYLLDLANANEEQDELCRFCLVPIHLEAEDIIQPCSCTTYIEGNLTDRVYSYCHTSCFTDYRVQRANNDCYIQCEDCKTFYAFGLQDLSRSENFIFSVKINRGVRYLLWAVWLVLYLVIGTCPIFGFMVLWRSTNHLEFSTLLSDNNLNLGTWVPYYLLGSLTWGVLLSFYWCCCVREVYGRQALHHHSRYHRGYRKYYGSYSGGGYYPIFFYTGNGSSSTSTSSGSGNSDMKGLLIIVLLLLILTALILAGVLIYICVELTNLRYKEYVKRLGTIKYKVIKNIETPPGYQPEPSTPPPPYVKCGYNGWI